ncbi:MAG: efflux RND transporter periplasmic adaptor subunit [Planctomycetota bacterium]|jgi:HlyD family secretion protein
MADTVSRPPAAVSAQSVGVLASKAAPAASRAGRTGRWLLFGGLGVALLGTAGYLIVSWARSGDDLRAIDKFAVAPRSFPVLLKEKGELEAAKSTDIICEVEGRSTIISLVEEGVAVREGDLLVEIASDKIEDRISQEELKEANAIMAHEAAKTELDIQRDKNASDIRKAELEIELKQLELEKYEKGEWELKLKDAEIAIDEAKINLDRREEDFNAGTELLTRGFITQTEYDEEEFKWQKAKWDLEKAGKAMEVLKDYTHVAELRRRQSDLDEAVKECARVKKNAQAEEDKKGRSLESKTKELAITQDQLAKLRTQREKCRITAPTPGFVVYFSEHWRRWSSGDQIKEGAEVHERQVLMQLPDTSEMVVSLRIHEAKTDKLRIGQPAVVEVEGTPGVQFQGTVSKIAVVADTQNRWLNPDLKEYETEVTLEPTDEALKPGVTAHVEILVDAVENRLAVPVQAVFSKAGRRYVFRERRGSVEHVEVHVGPRSTEWVEIADGLSEGDEVLLAFTDEHKRMIPDLRPLNRRNWNGRQTADATTAGATTAGARIPSRTDTSKDGDGDSRKAKQPSGSHGGKGHQRRVGQQRAKGKQ